MNEIFYIVYDQKVARNFSSYQEAEDQAAQWARGTGNPFTVFQAVVTVTRDKPAIPPVTVTRLQPPVYRTCPGV